MREQIGLKHSDLTDKIIGVFYDVYNELGYGFLESVYEEALVNNQRKEIRENPCESVAGVSL